MTSSEDRIHSPESERIREEVFDGRGRDEVERIEVAGWIGIGEVDRRRKDPSRSARMVNASSIAPLAPMAWPCDDFVELTGTVVSPPKTHRVVSATSWPAFRSHAR